MRYFLLGLAISYGAAAITVGVSLGYALPGPDPAAFDAAVLLAAVLPLVASWLVADVLDRLRPRLAFDPRTPRPLTTTIAGLATGASGVVLGAALITFLEPWVHEGVLLAAGGALAPMPVVLLMARRRRRDTCLGCGYDLSASSGQCPECGAVASRA